MLARIRRRITLAAIPLAFACSSSGPTEISYETSPPGIQAGYVAVTATSAGLVAINQTERPVFYFAVERGLLALIDWVPCTVQTGSCVGIAPGQTFTIPWDKVVGYKADATEYAFLWYHIATVNGTPTMTDGQTVIVKR